MQPLIQSFTKNLSECSGCGNGSTEPIYEAWLKAKETGGKMKFQVVVVIEAETYKAAINKVPDEFEILQGGVKLEPKLAPQGMSIGGQFSRTQAQPVPQISG